MPELSEQQIELCIKIAQATVGMNFEWLIGQGFDAAEMEDLILVLPVGDEEIQDEWYPDDEEKLIDEVR